jgi:hypothetical protein
MIPSLAAFLLGAAAWTLLEYLLHRYAFHGGSPKWPGAREHRQHHTQVDYFAPWWQKAVAAVVVTAILVSLLSQIAGMQVGFASTLGFVAMYLLYEVLHRRAHTHPPRGPYGRWLRRNHFAHHFINPRMAQGVTTPVWDLLFGTRLTFDHVPVPRRMAMPWLVDGNGEVKAAYASDYSLSGARVTAGPVEFSAG